MGGNMIEVTRKDAAVQEVYINGIPLAEYNRRKALPSRKLTPGDMPHQEWNETLYSNLLLREDGAVVWDDGATEVGYLKDGIVTWFQG